MSTIIFTFFYFFLMQFVILPSPLRDPVLRSTTSENNSVVIPINITMRTAIMPPMNKVNMPNARSTSNLVISQTNEMSSSHSKIQKSKPKVSTLQC